MASVNLDTTSRLDITCRRGDTFELTLTLKDTSGNGLDLATDNYQFLMQVRDPKATRRAQSTQSFFRNLPDEASEAVGSAVNTDGIVIGSTQMGVKGPVNFSFNGANDDGQVTVFLSADDMRKVASGRYRYDFQYKVGDTQKTVLEGSFRVNEDISKALS